VTDETRPVSDEIVRMHKDGMSEGMIVKQLGLTRHAVRTAIVFEEGRQAGIREAAAKQRSVEIHPSTGRYALGGPVSPAAPPETSRFNEELLKELMTCLREGRHVPEKVLRDKFHVSHNAMYALRAVAADRIQCGR
jgi:uncharacterized protein (DUF433 family)